MNADVGAFSNLDDASERLVVYRYTGASSYYYRLRPIYLEISSSIEDVTIPSSVGLYENTL